LVKLRLEGESVTCGATPVPLKVTLWGEPTPSSAIATEADRAPASAGVKATEIVQLAATASELPHVLVWLKSAALVPVTATLVIDSAAVPEFETVIV
jgi:hypothetical protein